MYVISISYQYFGGLKPERNRRFSRYRKNVLSKVDSVKDAFMFETSNKAISYVSKNFHRFSTFSDLKIYEYDQTLYKLKLVIDVGERKKLFEKLTGIYSIPQIRELFIKDERYDYMIRFTGSAAINLESQIKMEFKSLGIKIKDAKIDSAYYAVFVFLQEDDFVKFRLGQSITSNLDFVSIKEIWK